MKNNKRFAKYLSLVGATAFTAPIILTATGCSVVSNYFVIGTSNDVFANSVTQIGASFVDSPSTVEFRSAYGALVTYVNENDYKYDENGNLIQTPIARLVMEAASKIVVYGNKQNNNQAGPKAENKEEVLLTIDSNNLDDQGIDGNKPFIKENGSYSINLEAFGKVITNATRVEFTLNKDFKWVGPDGQVKQELVPRDFLYSLKGYKQSSDYSLNANGYYLSLSGVDYQKTIDYKQNDSIEAGGTFSYFLGETKTPYLLDIFTKQYFFPIPWSHPDTKATLGTPEQPNGLVFSQDEETKKMVIDKNKTDWSNVYGGAQEKGIDVWSIGPYYISRGSQQDVTFKLNQQYFDALEYAYEMNKLDADKKIPTIIKKYKAGSEIQMYNKFPSKELSYVKVPQDQSANAVQRYGDSQKLVPVPAPKASQGRFIGYNMAIYNSEGNLKDDKLVTKQYENFVRKFHTENSKKIRKGLNEYINWSKLAEVYFGTGTRDFSLSSIPYGVYPVREKVGSQTTIDYYNAIGSSTPLHIGDNNSSSTLTPVGLIGGKYKDMINSGNDIIASQQEIDDYRKLLDQEKYTKNDPLVFTYWTLKQAKNPKDTAYFQNIGSVINTLTEGRIKFEFKDFDAANTVTNVYNNKSVPMGDMLWGPDYNGLGTWIGIYFTYSYDQNGKPVEQKISNPETTQDVLQPAYHVTNLWKPLYEEMNKLSNDGSNTKVDDKNKWLLDLKEHLTKTKAAEFGNGKTYKDIRSNLDNEISIWSGISQSNGINLVNWIDNQAPILPMYQESLNYAGFKLVEEDYTVILNLNGDINYRDFVYKGE